MKTIRNFSLLLPLAAILLLATQCAGGSGTSAGSGSGCVEKSVTVLPNDFNTGIAAAGTNALVLDVRTPEEFNDGHLDGAVMINFYDSDFEQQLEKLDRNQPVFVYCRSGGRSAKVHAMLEKLCFKNITEMKGGYLAWTAKGMKTVK